MPLTYRSVSHGDVAFGFFNIETDLMLLNSIFFFASDFCAALSELADLKAHEPAHVDLRSYVLAEKDAGNLMGAINGVDYSGFIGDVYRMFPFPREPHLFKQNPEGFRTRVVMEDLIGKYAGLARTRVIADRYSDNFIMGPYVFLKESLASLLDYVWVGGMPRWKDEIRPSYVTTMKEKVLASAHPTFRGLDAFRGPVGA
jgi:hypothetical protein